jgi:sulfotransferase family protein
VAVAARKNQPVFVIGCHRSGTALLYDSLLSAGGFPLYHAAPFLHSTLLAMSGDPSVPRNRKRMLQIWLRSKPFRRTGLDPAEHGSRILQECKSGGDFLRITLGELACRAGVSRWASYDIDNIMHMAEVKREVPDALFVHVVRDGRDVAVSMKKQHGADQLWWAQERALYAWALLWQWTVRKGRRCGAKFPADYLEVRYEELVREPEKTLRTVGEFLDHDLDYGRIQKNSVGRVASPNTVWKEESNPETFHSIGRWKNKLSSSEIVGLEALIGDGLAEFGYSLSAERRGSAALDSRLALMRILYPLYFDTKLFVKSKTVLGRLLVNGDRLELSDAVENRDADAVPSPRVTGIRSQ